jgi:hypothetical protein
MAQVRGAEVAVGSAAAPGRQAFIGASAEADGRTRFRHQRGACSQRRSRFTRSPAEGTSEVRRRCSAPPCDRPPLRDGHYHRCSSREAVTLGLSTWEHEKALVSWRTHPKYQPARANRRGLDRLHRPNRPADSRHGSPRRLHAQRAVTRRDRRRCAEHSRACRHLAGHARPHATRCGRDDLAPRSRPRRRWPDLLAPNLLD